MVGCYLCDVGKAPAVLSGLDQCINWGFKVLLQPRGEGRIGRSVYVTEKKGKWRICVEWNSLGKKNRKANAVGMSFWKSIKPETQFPGDRN